MCAWIDMKKKGVAKRELKLLGQIFSYFFSILVCPALSKCQTVLAGTAYYKNQNLKNHAPSTSKCTQSKIWRICCSVRRCAGQSLPTSAAASCYHCHDSLHECEQGSTCCPEPNLLLQSVVSCTMKWIITTAAWKNIIWPPSNYSPMGADLWSLLKIDCAFNQQCCFRLSGHPAEKLEGYKRSIEIN